MRAELWWYFWVIWFLVSGASFAFIAAVVLFRGVEDLRAMIRLLEQHRPGEDESR